MLGADNIFNGGESPRLTSGRSPARAAAFAASMAAVLAIVKFTLFWMSGSLIVALSAFDSAIDVLVSFVNHRVIHYARQDADSDHPYGHGKAESIAALGQGALIAGAAITVLTSSVQRLTSGVESEIAKHSSFLLVGFFIVAAVASELIARMLLYFGRRFKSPALYGDAAHYRSDVFSNFGSALAVGLVTFSNKPWLDPAIAALLSIYIAWNGFRLLRTTVDDLMDHDVSTDVKERALKFIMETSEKIIDVHRFRGRRSGHRLFFDFHITLPDSLSFREIHDISDRIEVRMAEAFDADVTVHVDPESLPESSNLASSRRQK